MGWVTMVGDDAGIESKETLCQCPCGIWKVPEGGVVHSLLCRDPAVWRFDGRVVWPADTRFSFPFRAPVCDECLTKHQDMERATLERL